MNFRDKRQQVLLSPLGFQTSIAYVTFTLFVQVKRLYLPQARHYNMRLSSSDFIAFIVFLSSDDK